MKQFPKEIVKKLELSSNHYLINAKIILFATYQNI
jgi:hypothetical protein